MRYLLSMMLLAGSCAFAQTQAEIDLLQLKVQVAEAKAAAAEAKAENAALRARVEALERQLATSKAAPAAPVQRTLEEIAADEDRARLAAFNEAIANEKTISTVAPFGAKITMKSGKVYQVAPQYTKLASTWKPGMYLEVGLMGQDMNVTWGPGMGVTLEQAQEKKRAENIEEIVKHLQLDGSTKTFIFRDPATEQSVYARQVKEK